MNWLWIMAGGAFGSALRYAVALGLPQQGPAGFPWATLSVNVLGCALIGLLWTLCSSQQQLSEGLKLGLLIGVLGGFTTFSSFGLETLRMVTAGNWSGAGLYLLVSNGAGLLAVWLGARLGGGLPG